MGEEQSQFTVSKDYVDHEKQKTDLELKEISFLLYQVYDFHKKGDRHFSVPVYPYEITFLQTKNHPWLLISCKITAPDNSCKATFSFATSQDGQSFQNCSGNIDGITITKDSLNRWLRINPEFINLLRSKKSSYKENFFKDNS